eukprot:CAMPEP_0171310840 /NCGR_PEP_ID=MMETSP0816-20121228/21035_1 /TAXON_ID=420281 /ORGANISM="Proboscia inermis, Strain CCAP1064/1" /LENGTH=548 /DNA_ID=CAMNT_0011795201 /DNA_START=98 /DNA_END=1744 /DNA_ORIENTATION=+
MSTSTEIKALFANKDDLKPTDVNVEADDAPRLRRRTNQHQNDEMSSDVDISVVSDGSRKSVTTDSNKRDSCLLDVDGKRHVQNVRVVPKTERMGELLRTEATSKSPQAQDTDTAESKNSSQPNLATAYPTLYRLETRLENRNESRSNFSCVAWRRSNFFNGSSLNSVLTWSFRTNFPLLLCAFALNFIAITVVFAGLLWWSVADREECMQVAGADFTHNFYDAYSLSWTTLSTVGYGLLAPAADETSPSNCYVITLICTLESFAGILYASFCGAVIFGKVLRVQSQARVIFSDPICIRFGSGVDLDEVEQEVEDDGSVTSALEKGFIPFPVLEFRIANKAFHEENGEIVGASLKLVAAMSKVSDLENVRFQGSVGGEIIILPQRRMSITNTSSTRSSPQSKNFKPQTGSISFHNLNIETAEHPFFKRVWRVRHILDGNSPLLTRHAKRLIKKNNGGWPSLLNSSEGIRRSLLPFEAIIVSLSGVSNISANNVYAQKVYHFSEVNVGYQFAPMLFRNDEDYNSIVVDVDMINDVFQQRGGGGEPLEISI